MMVKQNTLFRFLAILNSICLIYVIILSYFNQLATDDFCHFKYYLQSGFHSPIKVFYFNANGRYLPMYFYNIFFFIFQKTGSIFWASFSLYILFNIGVYRFTKSFSKINHLPKINYQLLQITLFISNLIIFNNFKPSIFFWLAGNWMYFGGITFFLIAFSFWNKKQLNIYNWIVIIFGFWFAGCSVENNAFAFLFILGICQFLPPFKNKKCIQIGFIVILLSFISLIISPGSHQRMANTIGTENIESITDQIFKFIQIYPSKLFQIFFISIFIHLPTGILATIILNWLIKNNDSIFEINEKWLESKFKFILILFSIFLIVASTAPVVFALGQVGDHRILTLTSILLTLIYFLTLHKYFNKIFYYKISLVIICFWIFGFTYKIFNEFPKLSQYKKNQQALVNQILMPTKKEFIYKNDQEMRSPMLGNVIINTLIDHFMPEKKAFKNYLTNEPIWINRIENNDQKIFTDCFCYTLQTKTIIKTIK